MACSLFLTGVLFVEGRVHIVYILLVHFLLCLLDCFAESLEMHDLPLAQEADDVIHVRAVAETQAIDGFLILVRLGMIGVVGVETLPAESMRKNFYLSG